MRKGFVEFQSMMVTVLVVGLMFPVVSHVARAQNSSSSGQEDSVKKFLRDYLKGPRSEDDATARYSAALSDLKDDGTREVIAYVSGRAWCGSGGCRMLILAPEGSSYKVVTETTITRPPIRVLATKSNGWHDIGLWVQGGGIQPGYEAELSFDGKSYPRNPSAPPARRLAEKAAGEIVIPPKAEGNPLYQ
jgi:hypothetical protein